jgi:hypothetical protein
MDNHFLLEEYNAKQAIIPVDLNAGANAGARVSLAKHKRVSVVITLGDSTAAAVDVSFQQHNAASGGTSKALSIANKYFHKAGAATSFTQVEPTAAASSFNLASQFASQEGIVVFEILAEDLDVNGDFSHISVDIADTTAAKVGAAVYILRDGSFTPNYSVDV